VIRADVQPGAIVGRHPGEHALLSMRISVPGTNIDDGTPSTSDRTHKPLSRAAHAGKRAPVCCAGAPRIVWDEMDDGVLMPPPQIRGDDTLRMRSRVRAHARIRAALVRKPSE